MDATNSLEPKTEKESTLPPVFSAVQLVEPPLIYLMVPTYEHIYAPCASQVIFEIIYATIITPKIKTHKAATINNTQWT